MSDINFLRNISNINANLDINSIKKQSLNKSSSTKANEESKESSFKELLNEKQAQVNALSFSKHATERIEQRNIDIDESIEGKLNEALEQAKDKGLKNVLVMIDSSAFILNTLSNKVITALNNSELKGNIFTNIDGAVIK
jgi:flagellar operon protein